MARSNKEIFRNGSVTPLSEGFVADVKVPRKEEWISTLGDFNDANIYQTWGYGATRSGDARICHLSLRQHGSPVAAVQARLAGFPQLRLGLAYIRWGPLWNKSQQEPDPEVFRQAVRAIRSDFSIRRGLMVRLFPGCRPGQNFPFAEVLEEEGYELNSRVQPYRTIFMDLQPSLDELQQGLHAKWRKHLNRARRGNLEIIEGESDDLFLALAKVYNEMAERKNLLTINGIDPYRNAQRELAPSEKLTVILCKAEGEIVAGAMFSRLGDCGLDLFRATSNKGIQNYASYLIQWKVIEHLKRKNSRWYNLHGINPVQNPGGYQFKSQLAGKHGVEVQFPGAFECHPNRRTRLLARIGEQLRMRLKERGASTDGASARGSSTEGRAEDTLPAQKNGADPGFEQS
jgi:hypothetical protein